MKASADDERLRDQTATRIACGYCAFRDQRVPGIGPTTAKRDEQQLLREAAAHHEQDRADQADPNRDRIGRDHPARRRVPHGALVERERGGVDPDLRQIHEAADQLPRDRG